MYNHAPSRPRGENVLGPRTLAGLIDVAVLLVLFLIMSIASGQAETNSSDSGTSFNANLSGLPAVIYFALVCVYYAVPEALVQATLGKKVMGLKVTRDDGTAAGIGQVLGRTALCLIDGLPVFYLVGFISAAVRDDGKRLGDLAAHTRVVRA